MLRSLLWCPSEWCKGIMCLSWWFIWSFDEKVMFGVLGYIFLSFLEYSPEFYCISEIFSVDYNVFLTFLLSMILICGFELCYTCIRTWLTCEAAMIGYCLLQPQLQTVYMVFWWLEEEIFVFSNYFNAVNW